MLELKKISGERGGVFGADGLTLVGSVGVGDTGIAATAGVNVSVAVGVRVVVGDAVAVDV